jgi:hypothetical protein
VQFCLLATLSILHFPWLSSRSAFTVDDSWTEIRGQHRHTTLSVPSPFLKHSWRSIGIVYAIMNTTARRSTWGFQRLYFVFFCYQHLYSGLDIDFVERFRNSRYSLCKFLTISRISLPFSILRSLATSLRCSKNPRSSSSHIVLRNDCWL